MEERVHEATGHDVRNVNVRPCFHQSDLFNAVLQGNIGLIQYIFSSGWGNVAAVDELGQTVLFAAVKQGNSEVVEALLTHGADVSITGVEGQTALFYAASLGNVKVVESLLTHGADVNETNHHGQTALFVAVEKGNVGVIRTLLGRDHEVVNKPDRSGETALFVAVSHNNIEVVKVLLNEGADVNTANWYGQTVLFVAARHGNVKVIKLLLSHGSDVNAVDHQYDTALVAAVQQNSLEAVEALLHSKTNVNARNGKKRTVLFAAAELGNVRVVQALLDHGIDVNATDVLGQTALFAAALGGNVGVVDTLLIHVANVNVTDENGQTVLFAAAQGGNVGVVDTLLIHVANVNVTDENGQTVLFAAVEGGSSEVVQALLRHQLDVNATDHEGQTPLFAATNSLHDQMAQRAKVTTTRVTSDAICQVIDVLVSNGARADARNDAEETPLLHYLACGLSMMKNRDSVKTLIAVCHFLIETKISIKAINDSGRTVIHLVLLLLRGVLKEEVQGTQETQVTAMLEIAQRCLKLLCSIYSSPRWSERMAAKYDLDGNTPLHLWASISYPRDQCSGGVSLESILSDIASKLFDHGEKCDTTNGRGETPLHMAQTWSAAKILIGQGADPKLTDSHGNTPLLKHVKQNLTNRIFNQVYEDGKVPLASQWSEIVKSGMGPWQANRAGATVLSSLLEEEAFDVIQALIDATHSNGGTCLHEICKDASKAPPVKEYPIDSNGDTCLHVICRDGREDNNWKLSLIDLLVKSTPSIVNCENRKKKTALHILCERGKADDLTCQMIEKLRAQGAEVDTCTDIASRNPRLKELLEKDVKCSEGALCRLWSSKSEKHKDLLAQVARNQKVVDKGSFCYHTSPIGSGEFGKVYAGLTKDGREAAVKCLEKEQMCRPVGEREIENLVRFDDCEQVVRFLGSKQDNHCLYIVLELMEGTVEELLGGGVPLQEDELVSLSKDVLSGLNFLHQNMIFHRDIHPGNILYKKIPKGNEKRCSFQLTLADFGLSSRELKKDPSVMHSKAGLRCWMAPELLACIGTLTHSEASDVFACGLVLHYVLSRKKHPFVPLDEAEKSRHVVMHETEQNILDTKVEPVIDKDLSPEAADLVRLMVNHSKDERPAARKALEHPLFWSNNRKKHFLIAVADQTEFKGRGSSDVKEDLRYAFSSQFSRNPWDGEIREIFQKISKKPRSGVQYRYNTKSAVDLVVFVRNAYAHINEPHITRSVYISVIEDYVFLVKFPTLVMHVYNAVMRHGWDVRRSIKSAMNES